LSHASRIDGFGPKTRHGERQFSPDYRSAEICRAARFFAASSSVSGFAILLRQHKRVEETRTGFTHQDRALATLWLHVDEATDERLRQLVNESCANERKATACIDVQK
jgi:hypothetical protein